LALVREVVGMGKLLDRFRQEGPSRPRSKADADKRRRTLILLLIVLAVVSSLSVVGYGYYETSVKPWRQPIVKVNGTVIRMRTFVKMLRLYGVSDLSSAPSYATVLGDYELKEQYLESEFSIEINDDAVDAKFREMLVSDNATDDAYDEAYKNMVTQLKDVGVTVKDVKNLYLRPPLVEEELRKQIGDRDYPSTDNFEHAQVQALLIQGSDNATLMRTRWENGEAFDTLSKDGAVTSYLRDFAEDNTTANWVAKGAKSDAFDNYTFSASPSVLSDPIQDTDDTTNYWLIKVMGTESRSLSETDRTTLVADAYDKWLSEAKDSGENKIVYYLDKKGGPAKLAWAIDHVAVSKS
jgi:hypothetical protein